MSAIKEKILHFITNKKSVTAKEIIDTFAISRQAIHKHLREMVEKGLIEKIGNAPKVFYLPKKIIIRKAIIEKGVVSGEKIKIINENYLIITPDGKKLEGMDAFIYWCEKQNLPLGKTADEYVVTREKYYRYKKEGLIVATAKLSSSFKEVGLDTLYYIDFYSIERFGKTKLGQLLLYAKQSQDTQLMKQVSDIAKPLVHKLITTHRIDAVVFIPPTVKREVQFMKELRRFLDVRIQEIDAVKIRGDVVVPQKTLNKIEDRIENARKTIFINESRVYKNILLIDDAVGSGATLNETALQIKARGICKGKIIGLAITGSFKGFDVISEV